MSMPSEVYNPEWEKFHKQFKAVHDWRTYIPENIQKMWDSISIEGRLLMYEVADYAASMEHWD